MFASVQQYARRLSHRAPASPSADVAARPVEPNGTRHPAMRGIDVSPVHGRHCICDRCGPAGRHDRAA
jgi:hypothetical protein